MAGWKMDDVFPIKNWEIPASYVIVYQRVSNKKNLKRFLFKWCNLDGTPKTYSTIATKIGPMSL